METFPETVREKSQTKILPKSRSKAKGELFCLEIALFLSLDFVPVHLIPDDLW